MNYYLGRDEPAQALELAQRYPRELLVAVNFGRGLALWRLGRRAEAEEVLRSAAMDRPHVVRMLTAAEAPPEPELLDFGYRVGGEDEAWLYREAMLDVWQRTPDALAFLAGLELPAPGRRRSRRARQS